MAVALLTPVIDELAAELEAVNEGVVQAQQMLKRGNQVGSACALTLVAVVLERTAARRWTLQLFAAARHEESQRSLLALAVGLDLVESSLRGALQSVSRHDLAMAELAAHTALDALAEARSEAGLLAQGPLGRQIRILHLEGLLD